MAGKGRGGRSSRNGGRGPGPGAPDFAGFPTRDPNGGPSGKGKWSEPAAAPVPAPAPAKGSGS